MTRIEPAELRQAVAHASRVPTLMQTVAWVYAQLALRTAGQSPRCDRSGRCCRFDAYGHRLFASTAEIAYFLAHTSESVLPDDPAGCAYQRDGLCSVHASRPFGCRVFFCDPTAEAWQRQMYQEFHRTLRDAHDQTGVAYLYVEWRDALRVCGRVCASQTERVSGVARSLPVIVA